MIKTIKEFFHYILNPKDRSSLIDIFKKKKIKTILSLLILTIVFNAIIIITRSVLIDYGFIPKLLFKNSNPLADFWFYPLAILIISPILEELGFRLFFIPNRINNAISFSILFYFLSYLIFPFSLYAINIYLIFPVVFFVFLLLITIKSVISTFLNDFITKYFKIIFYLSAAFYTYTHVINFRFEENHIIWLPLIFLPYLMLGFVLGYIRVILGIKYSIIFHFVYNSFPFLLSLVFLG